MNNPVNPCKRSFEFDELTETSPSSSQIKTGPPSSQSDASPSSSQRETSPSSNKTKYKDMDEED